MENWKIILTFIYPHEAHMAKGFLESEGIESFIQDEMTVQVNSFYSNAIGGVKLLVKESDFDEGITILKKGGYINTEKEVEKAKIETHMISSNSEKLKCPYCGSENIERAREPNLFSIIVVLLANAFFPFFKRYYHCFDCKKHWRFKMKKI